MNQDSPCSTLERVANLLSPNDRERFLIVVARFRNIPQDDEYLLVLEAIGFMTLLWKTVPSEIEKILTGASPVGDTGSGFTKLVRETVNEAIPSQQDLRAVVHSLREHEIALRDLCRGNVKKMPVASYVPLLEIVVLVFFSFVVRYLGFFSSFQ